MSSKMKMRSISVEDLSNIVKHMIDDVLEDNDQVAELCQTVFEEYHCTKKEELRKAKAKIEADCKFNQKAIESQIIESVLKGTGQTKPANAEIIDTCPSYGTVKLSESGMTCLGKLNEMEVATGSAIDAPVIHVLRRHKYVEVTENDDVQISNDDKSNIALDVANHNTTMDLTRTVNAILTKSKENVESEKKMLRANLEIIEWQSGRLRKEISQETDQSGKTREIPVQFKSRGEIAFERWTKGKTAVYDCIFKEAQERKRIEKAEIAKQIEKREAANKAYLYGKRQRDARQKLSSMRKQILAQMESQKLEFAEKCKANSQAFKIWKKQKDIKLRERKLYMMAYSDQSYSHQQQNKSQKPKPGINVAFNMWLDQLDCVLHQKYLRERRYLVRSFYCQPAYFGTAALCGR